MKRFNITVNGKAYDVAVEELGASSAPSAPAFGWVDKFIVSIDAEIY